LTGTSTGTANQGGHVASSPLVIVATALESWSSGTPVSGELTPVLKAQNAGFLAEPTGVRGVSHFGSVSRTSTRELNGLPTSAAQFWLGDLRLSLRSGSYVG
jgi:hypothetical protein